MDTNKLSEAYKILKSFWDSSLVYNVSIKGKNFHAKEKIVSKKPTIQDAIDAITALGAKVDKVNAKVDKVDAKVDKVNAKVDKVNAKVDKVDAKVDKVNAKVDKVNAKVDKVNARIDSIVKLNNLKT